mgnify:CR=1 FL=1
MEKMIFGADFDYSEGAESMDVLEKLRRLATFLPYADSCQMEVVGELDTKDAFRKK